MSKKSNKVTIPKNPVYPKDADIIPTINEVQGGLIKVNTNTPTKTGSPTTGNSGLVSPKKTKTGTKTPRQKANVTSNNSSSNSNELRISQKRQLATDITRRLARFEPVISKVVRLLIDQNIITNENKLYSYNVDVPVNANGYSMILIVTCKSQPNTTNIQLKLEETKLFPEVIIKQHTDKKVLSITLNNYREQTKTTSKTTTKK